MQFEDLWLEGIYRGPVVAKDLYRYVCSECVHVYTRRTRFGWIAPLG